MNRYTIKYTTWKIDGEPDPQHRLYTFTSDNDLLSAANEGMLNLHSKIDTSIHDMLFRSIELLNAKEVYEKSVTTN